MTQIKIYSPSPPKPEPEAVAYLRLIQSGEFITLEAVDENGNHANCGDLMKFFSDGTYQKIVNGEVVGQKFRERSY